MYVRLVSDHEFAQLQEHHELVESPNDYPPYGKGQVICLFETEDVRYIIRRFGAACADTRLDQAENDFIVLTVLIFEGLDTEKIKVDESQSGWNESRVYLNKISIDKIRIWGTFGVKAKSVANTSIDENSIKEFENPIQVS